VNAVGSASPASSIQLRASSIQLRVPSPSLSHKSRRSPPLHHPLHHLTSLSFGRE
jgi:hypothetical protein